MIKYGLMDEADAITGTDAQNWIVPSDMQLIDLDTIVRRGATRERYQQKYEGVDVLGAQITVRKNSGGDNLTVVGAYYPSINPRNSIILSEVDALLALPARSSREALQPSDVKLVIDPLRQEYFYLIIEPDGTQEWVHIIQTETGDISSYDSTPTTSEGKGVNGDDKDLTGLTTEVSPNTYYMRNSTNTIHTYDCGNQDGNINIGNNPIPITNTEALGSVEYWDDLGAVEPYRSPGHAAAVDAQYYANLANQYYISVHSFSFVQAYTGIYLAVHFDENIEGAKWVFSDKAIYFGDGHGVSNKLKEASGSLEIVGHEMGHGIVDQLVQAGTGSSTNGFSYYRESGALDEAFADIMGTSIEYYFSYAFPWLIPTGQVPDWLIGEDIGLPQMPGGDPYLHRRMDAPNAIENRFDCNDPSSYGNILRNPEDPATYDNEFVHFNSGILNHWFYLLLNGGLNADEDCRSDDIAVVPIGTTNNDIQWAAGLVYDAYGDLNSTATICNARIATIAYAQSSGHEDNVESAWDEVGVTPELCDPPTVSIELPTEGEIIGGPDEVTLQGYAFDRGGIEVLKNNNISIRLLIKKETDTEFTNYLNHTSFQKRVERNDVCPPNTPDPPEDTCIWDSDSICLVTTDPNCPNVGWTASFDTRDYLDGIYDIRLEAVDYQGNVSYVDRQVVIDNSHLDTITVPPEYETWVDEQNSSKNYCTDEYLYVEGDTSGELMYTYLHFEVPNVPGWFISSSLDVRVSRFIVQDLEVYEVEDQPWGGCWPTWDSKPSGQESFINSSGYARDDEVVEIDVSTHISGPGRYTLKLVDQEFYNAVRRIYSTRNQTYSDTPRITILYEVIPNLIFMDGFESGTTSAWSSTVN
jgi:thermolysin